MRFPKREISLLATEESWKLNGVIILALEVGENREKTGYLKKIGHRYSNKKWQIELGQLSVGKDQEEVKIRNKWKKIPWDLKLIGCSG